MDLLHKTHEAKAVATEQGQFTAIAAAYSVDRMNERILPGAFKASIANWRKSGKQIPLHWDHSGDAADIIGTVDPKSMRETKAGLEVSGQLDLLESAVAKDAWRLMKRDAVSLSFGYLVTDSVEAKDGVKELKAIDLFEITITPAPANPDTRFLSLKAIADGGGGPDAEAFDEEEKAAMTDHAKLVQQAMAIAHRLHPDGVSSAVTSAIFKDPQAYIDANKGKAADYEKALKDPEVIALAPGVEIDGPELVGAQLGDLKAVWTTAEINSLPDSAFLYVEQGGSKDSEGKTTPRSLRHFPYKDSSGKVDLPHLRNALARIPQSNLPQSVKDRLTAQAQKLLANPKSLRRDSLRSAHQARMVGFGKAEPSETPSDDVSLAELSDLREIWTSNLSLDVKDRLTAQAQKILESKAIEDARDEEASTRPKSVAQDPLRQESQKSQLDALMFGFGKAEPAQPEPEPEPVPVPDASEIKRASREAQLAWLRG